RLRPAREAASSPSLGCRSVRARLLLLCPAGQGGLPSHPCRARRRSRVLRRRGVFTPRLFHGARRLSHWSGRGGPSNRRSSQKVVVTRNPPDSRPRTVAL